MMGSPIAHKHKPMHPNHSNMSSDHVVISSPPFSPIQERHQPIYEANMRPNYSYHTPSTKDVGHSQEEVKENYSHTLQPLRDEEGYSGKSKLLFVIYHVVLEDPSPQKHPIIPIISTSNISFNSTTYDNHPSFMKSTNKVENPENDTLVEQLKQQITMLKDQS
jgi:hypothetical protein